MTDFQGLYSRGVNLELHKRDLLSLDNANFALFVTDDDAVTLNTMRDENRVPHGFLISSNIDIGRTYTNPYDSRTHLKVIDVDFEREQALLLVVDND